MRGFMQENLSVRKNAVKFPNNKTVWPSDFAVRPAAWIVVKSLRGTKASRLSADRNLRSKVSKP
jgi:hypothetical protein